MHAQPRSRRKPEDTVTLRSGHDLTSTAWRSAAVEMKEEWKALRECFPDHKNFGDLWRFRQAWGLDEARGRAAAVVASAWVAWEFCGLGVWLCDRVAFEAIDEGSRTVAWRWRLARHYWDDLLVAAEGARLEAFEALGGVDRSRVPAPPLEAGMQSTERGLLVEIGDVWQRRLGWMQERQRVASLVPGEEEREGELDCAEREILALKGQMLADLRTILAFETNPAHWEPTPEQLELLPLVWRRRFEFKEALSKYIGTRRNAPEEMADARTALALLRTEMAAAGPRTARR